MPNSQLTLRHIKMGFTSLLTSIVVLMSIFSSPLNAAFCSLRDPIAAINVLYPESESHRSIVKPVNQGTRQLISDQLPFSLHFNEIGQHTLYVALKDKQPIGFVHARSELSNNGMIEIAWAINLDMSLNDFFFQRCRSPLCTGALPQQLSQQLQGKTYTELLGMLDETSSNLTPAMQVQYSLKSDLVLSVIRSALKTISVTQIAWRADIEQLRRQALINKHFGPQSVAQLRPSTTSSQIAEFKTDSIIQSDKVKTYVVLNKQQTVGYLAEADWKQGEQEGQTNWLFSPQGEVLDITATEKWPTHEIQMAFQDVIGKDFSTGAECSTAVEFAGKFLYTSLFAKR